MSVAWAREFAGLPAGPYETIVYGPGRSDVPSGLTRIAAFGMDDVPGGLDVLVEDDSFDFLPGGVFVSAGVPLVVSGSRLAGSCAGVSGVQLLPEPGFGLGIAIGLVGLSRMRRRSASSRSDRPSA